MSVRLSFSNNDIVRSKNLFIACPFNLKNLWLPILYEDFLYKKQGLEQDLYLLIRNQKETLFLENCLYDELGFILDFYAVEADKVFKTRILKEFDYVCKWLIQEVKSLPIYDNKGFIYFQGLEFIDAYTVGFYKISTTDIE